MTNRRRGPLTLLLASRRFRRVAAFTVGLVLLYVLSFGPACWWTAPPAGGPFPPGPKWMAIYWPFGALLDRGHAPRVLKWWMMLGVKGGHFASVPVTPDSNEWIGLGVTRFDLRLP